MYDDGRDYTVNIWRKQLHYYTGRRYSGLREKRPGIFTINRIDPLFTAQQCHDGNQKDSQRTAACYVWVDVAVDMYTRAEDDIV
jgi:hypothetical protein